jgi:hypothetical protein
LCLKNRNAIVFQLTHLSRPGIGLLQAHICVKLLEFRVNACTRGVEEPARPKRYKILVNDLNKIMWSSDRVVYKQKTEIVLISQKCPVAFLLYMFSLVNVSISLTTHRSGSDTNKKATSRNCTQCFPMTNMYKKCCLNVVVRFITNSV